jgi:predicted enzyme related to lactoylglutathione lyase
MFATGSGPIAGMMRLSDELRQKGVPPHWLPYIGADDVDATVASAERFGAKVQHAPSDIENNVGRFAVLTDPQGAAFGVYRPGQAGSGAPRGTPAPGQYSWHELATSDAEAAFEFYSTLFGWQAMQRMDMGAAGTYLIFGRDGQQRGGMYKLTRAAGPHWLSYVEVASADAAATAAREAGAKVLNGPMDVPGGRIVQLTDPAGALFAVHSSAKAAAHPSPEKKPDAGAGPAAPKPAKRAEAETPRPSSPPSGRGDGSKVTSAPSAAQTRPSATGGAPAGASARPPSTASSAAPAAKKAPAKKAAAKKAAKKKAAKKAAKKSGRAKAAGKKSAGRRAASKRGGRARSAAKKKSSTARRPAKSARRAGGRKAARKSSAKSARRGRRGRR